MEKGTVPPNWADLVEFSTELATNQDYNLAETWLEESTNLFGLSSTNSSPGLTPADPPVCNNPPFCLIIKMLLIGVQ